MYWADKISQEIIKSKKYQPYWVDDMKTPSGRIHIGSLRGVVIHDLIYKSLLDDKVPAKFTYVFEDHDPMDEVSSGLNKEEWSKYLGQPLFTVPSPDGKADSYAKYFASEFTEVFNKVACQPTLIWVSDLYKTGKMNAGVKACLDNAKTIRKIYEKLYHKKISDDWFPFQVVCPKCGKVATTKVTAWDGKEVSFACENEVAKYISGCGFTGKTSPFSGDGKFAGKLPWKIEWAVKWQVIGVTIEGAGKDHMSDGGSHDVAKLVCEKVLKYPVPYPIAYEFFLLGGKKMSSSKGLGTSAKEISEMLPSYLLRFLFVRTDYRRAIEFEPVGTMLIPDLFDEYDRCWQAYNQEPDSDFARVFELSQTEKLPKKNPKLFLPRFRDVANYIQQNVGIFEKFGDQKGSKLTPEEEEILSERQNYAHLWVDKCAPEEYRLSFSRSSPKTVADLSSQQKEFLQEVIPLVEKNLSAEQLNLALYNLAKELKIDSQHAFSAIYQAFIGKTHGPKAAWFLLQYPKEQVLERLSQISLAPGEVGAVGKYQTIEKPEFFSIAADLKQKYPSISVGVAMLKGVEIKKENPALEKEKNTFLSSAKLTTEQIGTFPEILSYRQLYREMGVDWHSRWPSPEALLRRVALGKGLYTVNTCVDAYNLVVMQHRVSVGAFDADEVKFPTILRLASEGDEILLLGDEEPTKYTAKEFAYYDQLGGYNIDFNYRDAKRTKVTEKTKNLWINVDGIFDITPEQVQVVLNESVKKIQKYCGGSLEFSGVVTG